VISRRTGLSDMIKVEISLTGAEQDELRQLEALMQQVLASLTPHPPGIEATVKKSEPINPYATTKERILNIIRSERVRDCMPEEFWLVYIQDWLNPKDKKNLRPALGSLCDDGMLEQTGEWEYYLTTKGFDAIY
jgi:hypothetical protein